MRILWSRIPLLAVLVAAGCAAPRIDIPPGYAADVVCLANGELGCVRVRIEEGTPRAAYRGKTYYFCSEGCREAFEKAPERYVPQNDR